MKLVKRIEIRTTAKSTIERHPVPVLGIDYKVKIEYRNIKIAELDVEGKTIKISLPNKYKKTSNTQILDLAIEKMYEQIAKVEIERAMEKARILLGFAPEDYEIQKMVKKLGKYEENKITIHPDVVKYHRDFIDYVILHQYCHMKYKTHAKSFYQLLEKVEPNYKKYEQMLKQLEK